MSAKETLKRYVFFSVGLFINAFGVSFITKASLGTSPISSIPYVLSLSFKPTMGMAMKAASSSKNLTPVSSSTT